MVRTRKQGAPLLSLVPGLEAVEERLGEMFDTGGRFTAGLCAHVIGAGGKRLRPALVLISAGGSSLTGPDPALVNAAAAMELIHTASLIHDDIMDGAGHRRGTATLHSMWGEHTSVLAGDYLFALSFSLLAASCPPEAVATAAGAVQAMCEGQIEETRGAGNPDITEAQYLDRIEKKTARLLAAACQIGAIQAGLPAAEVQALYEFGRDLGLAFQLADDLLDIDGGPAEMGKAAGSDILNGVTTLPVIHAMSHPGYAWVRDHIAGPGPYGLPAVLDAVRVSGGIEYTRRQVARYTDRALRALEQVSDLCSRRILARLAQSLRERGA